MKACRKNIIYFGIIPMNLLYHRSIVEIYTYFVEFYEILSDSKKSAEEKDLEKDA